VLNASLPPLLRLACLSALFAGGLACDPPDPVPEASPVHEAAKKASEAPELKQTADGSYLYDPGDRSFKAIVHPTGEVEFRDFGGAHFSDEGIRVNGPTEWADRAEGKAKHSREKAAFLEKTHEQRTQMATAYADKSAKAAMELLRKQLEAADETFQGDVAKLREHVFKLWDECAEGEASQAGSPIDAARIEYGKAARAVIEGFIRRRMPRGTDDAFSAEEIELRNATRVSKTRFDPYDQW
jgi:hypothetical protein